MDRLREMQPNGELLKVMRIRTRNILYHMLKHGSVEMIRCFALEFRADLNASIVVGRCCNELPPLCVCVDLVEIVDNTGALLRSMECLIQLGADVDVRDHIGRTALCIAIEKGFTQAVSLLVASKADRFSVQKSKVRLEHRNKKRYVPKNHQYIHTSAWAVLRKAELPVGVKAEIQFMLRYPDRLAFAMGRHPRLGRGSLVAQLDGDILRAILSLL